MTVLTIYDFQKFLSVNRKKNGEKLMPSTIERYVGILDKYFIKLSCMNKIKERIDFMNIVIHRRNSIVVYSAFVAYLSFIGVDVTAKEGWHKQLQTPKKHANAFSSIKFLQSKVLSRSEIRMMRNNCDNKTTQLAISILYDTAARRAELMHLKFKDIQVMRPSHAVELKEIKSGIFARVRLFGKGGKSRTAYLHQSSMKLMLELFGNIFNDEDFIIRFYKNDDKKTPYADQEGKLYKEIIKYGDKLLSRDIHPHCFRHTRATHLADKGMSALQLKAYLGHKNIQATEIYIEISESTAHKAIKEFSFDIDDESGDVQ